jgi:phenylalanyl-tRNA synthetase alpha chain
MHLRLPPHQHALLLALNADPQDTSIEALCRATGVDQSLLTAAAVELQREGLMQLYERTYTELRLGELGLAIQTGAAELPERSLARAVRQRGGAAGLKDLSADGALSALGIQPGKFAKSLAGLGWASFDKGALTLTPVAAVDEPPACDIEVALASTHIAGGAMVVEAGGDPRVLSGMTRAKGRAELLHVKERARRIVTLTFKGQELARQAATGEIGVLREVSELTPEMLLDGSWREVQFRAYDVTLAAERLTPGKTHPLSRLVDEVRLAFLELGFSEATCPMAEAAFWDFDALFQPQDHPAREMQDTFYCAVPARYPLPQRADWVERVRATHENGGDTGSKGWRYAWSPERAGQVVLRTHMTSSSIRAIARDPRAPQKVFSIGRVFRRETVDYKHLPEFMQVDGIIIDEQASFSCLLGTLATFYARMGIAEVQFKPDFFPYTEPSVGVQIKWGDKWLEMGGAGVFRPEVTLPFGCSAPVLAWGLGLERLAMARFGVASIKDLYQADLDWLKEAALGA